MLFLLFGSSAAGKTFVLAALRGRVADLAVHDFDEIGVPAGADTAWRHRADRAVGAPGAGLPGRGHDLLLAGQTPFGELLAAPSASRLDAISACLIDCDDDDAQSHGFGRAVGVVGADRRRSPGLPQLGGLDARARCRPVVTASGNPAGGDPERDALVAVEWLAGEAIRAGVYA